MRTYFEMMFEVEGLLSLDKKQDAIAKPLISFDERTLVPCSHHFEELRYLLSVLL
jgi:hypothetical protein